MKTINKQQGYSLFLVMILMIVIAFLVIVTSQSSLTEMRMSSNEADRKLALSRAEFGLKAAENVITENTQSKKKLVFKADCADGLCAPVETVNIKRLPDLFFLDTASTSKVNAWERCAADTNKACTGGDNSKTVLDDAKKSMVDSEKKSRYIIEYLGGTKTEGVEIFRVTAKAYGDNADTVVKLQTYVELTNVPED